AFLSGLPAPGWAAATPVETKVRAGRLAAITNFFIGIPFRLKTLWRRPQETFSPMAVAGVCQETTKIVANCRKELCLNGLFSFFFFQGTQPPVCGDKQIYQAGGACPSCDLPFVFRTVFPALAGSGIDRAAPCIQLRSR